MLVLASKSPRRRELMALITPIFEVGEAGVKEEDFTAGTPAQISKKLAQAKAAAVFIHRPADVVIGCDTVVELEGTTLGKPAHRKGCVQMLSALSGKRHFVHTGVCILAPDGKKESFVETTAVNFASIPEDEIIAYAFTEEPYDKAGGYGVQGWAAKYIPRIEGCYYNVMGLPVASLYHALKQMMVL